MSEITVLLLYIIAAVSLVLSRLPHHAPRQQLLLSTGFISGAIAFAWHAALLWGNLDLDSGLSISLANITSFIGLQLAFVGLLSASNAGLRGLAAGLLILASIGAQVTQIGSAPASAAPMAWQLQAHVLISLFAYGLLTVGAIVAVYALMQDRRLRTGQLTAVNLLFAPLETTEQLLFGVTAAGFASLLIAILSGLAFVEDLFAQHLSHKTVLSIIALGLFGVLLAGRHFAGWRGRQAIYLYLWGFGMLCLAYYGARFVLENVLGRSWS